MAVSSAIILPYVIGTAVAATAYTGYEAHQDAKASRKEAEAQAAQQREALATLKAEPLAAIPIADEQAKAGRRRSITAQMRRRGRASTILTSQDTASPDVLGT